MTLSSAARITNGTLQGEDRGFEGVSIDSRTLVEGELFVAIAGERFDGHRFVEAANSAGASGAMVSTGSSTALSLVRVADTRPALATLAAHWRGRFELPVIGITGSNGKTTVKEMAGAILATTGPGLVTAGNLNNELGLPLTLLRLRPQHRYAVLELGMNHAGEIAYLASLARPSLALITNAAPAHLEGLGTVAAVARAKGELIEGLPADGIAVINADDPHAPLWRELAGARRVVRFGLEREAEVSADWECRDSGTRMRLRTPRGELSVTLPVAGRHNVMNALAAAAAALETGARLAQLKAGLEAFTGVPGRGQLRITTGGVRLIDDSYNANPGSLVAALEVLATAPGRRVLVLGDMGELGEGGAALHGEAGEAARAAGVSLLVGVGELAAIAVRSFGTGGVHAAHRGEALDLLRDALAPGDTVLVKGSRAMRMEEVVRGLEQTDPDRGAGRPARTE